LYAQTQYIANCNISGEKLEALLCFADIGFKRVLLRLHVIKLVYIDDVVEELIRALNGS